MHVARSSRKVAPILSTIQHHVQHWLGTFCCLSIAPSTQDRFYALATRETSTHGQQMVVLPHADSSWKFRQLSPAFYELPYHKAWFILGTKVNLIVKLPPRIICLHCKFVKVCKSLNFLAIFQDVKSSSLSLEAWTGLQTNISNSERLRHSIFYVTVYCCFSGEMSCLEISTNIKGNGMHEFFKMFE
jgi:hypothetical protein